MNNPNLIKIPYCGIQPPHKNKTETLVRCPKCHLIKNRKSRIFKSPQSLWKHIWQVHQSDKTQIPSTDDTVMLLEVYCVMLKLGMIVK